MDIGEVSIWHEGNNRAFKSSASLNGVVAMLEGIIRFGIVRGVRRRWLLSFAHYASGQIPLLSIAVSTTACL